jgi:hypothetical protein
MLDIKTTNPHTLKDLKYYILIRFLSMTNSWQKTWAKVGWATESPRGGQRKYLTWRLALEHLQSCPQSVSQISLRSWTFFRPSRAPKMPLLSDAVQSGVRRPETVSAPQGTLRARQTEREAKRGVAGLTRHWHTNEASQLCLNDDEGAGEACLCRTEDMGEWRRAG